MGKGRVSSFEMAARGRRRSGIPAQLRTISISRLSGESKKVDLVSSWLAFGGLSRQGEEEEKNSSDHEREFND